MDRFQKGQIRRSDLSWANLKGAMLAGVDLTGIDLIGADLAQPTSREPELQAPISQAPRRNKWTKGPNAGQVVGHHKIGTETIRAGTAVPLFPAKESKKDGAGGGS